MFCRCEVIPMKLREAFSGSEARLELLCNKANAFDHEALFSAALREVIQNPNQILLSRVIQELSFKLDQKAQTEPVFSPLEGQDLKPLVFSGQQAYVDYSLNAPVRMYTIESLSDRCLGFFGFVDYDFFGSDSLITQIKLPAILQGTPDFLLRVRVYSNFRDQKKKDMRFIPQPDQEPLRDTFKHLQNAIMYSFSVLKRETSLSIKKESLERLEGIRQDFEFARLHSSSAAEFNTIWSVRIFRKMGYQIPFCRFSELLDHEGLMDPLADTLGQTIRENSLFVESINEIINEAGSCDLCIRPVEAGYIPIFMTDRETGIRFPIKCKRIGSDYQLSSTGKIAFSVNIGRSGKEEVKGFLSSHRRLWSPNIFLPLFLYRCGLKGFISGRSSVRYSAVIGHVMERLFQEKHPPNLYCVISIAPRGILHRAVEVSQRKLPESLMNFEPTLFYKMIFASPKEVRDEVGALRKEAINR